LSELKKSERNGGNFPVPLHPAASQVYKDLGLAGLRQTTRFFGRVQITFRSVAFKYMITLMFAAVAKAH
jgi:hypothetical protein